MNDEHYRKAVGFAYVRNQAFKYGEPLVFFDADEVNYAFYRFDYQVIPLIFPNSLHPQKWKTLYSVGERELPIEIKSVKQAKDAVISTLEDAANQSIKMTLGFCWEPGIDDAMYLTAYQRLWSREILDAN